MKRISQIEFFPTDNRAELSHSDGAFSGVQHVHLDTLPDEQQEGVAAAIGWLAGVAESLGFAAWTSCVLVRQGSPDAAHSFAITIRGSNAAQETGERTVASVPGAETDAIGELWLEFESALNPPAPEPEIETEEEVE